MKPMKNTLNKIFKKKNNIIIGVIHFPPLLGYPKFPGLDVCLRDALKDLKSFQGKVDGLFIENNYDIPHKQKVDPEIVAAMTYLGSKVRSATNLPLGISVLWNDYQAALSMAKILNYQFIRVPVFVDKVKTKCGIIQGKPKEVIKFRKSIKADQIALFTDIHVKHSKLLSKYSIIQSARRAVKFGSDALIITGRWTGQAPNLKELQKVRKSINQFPILIGSGGAKDNIANIFQYANGAIISTSLKQGRNRAAEVNVKSWRQRIDKKNVIKLAKAVQ